MKTSALWVLLGVAMLEGSVAAQQPPAPASRIPAAVILVLTHEFCTAQVTKDDVTVRPGPTLCPSAEEAVRNSFGQVIRMDTAPTPQDTGGHLVLIPRYADMEGTTRATIFGKRKTALLVEWSAIDPNGRIFWVQTVEGDGLGGIGEVEEMARRDLIAKSTEAIGKSQEIRQFLKTAPPAAQTVRGQIIETSKKEDTTGMPRVAFLRWSSFVYANAPPVVIYCDLTEVASLRNKMYFEIALSPGVHVCYADVTYNMTPKELALEVKPGPEQWVSMGFKSSGLVKIGATLESMDPAEARKEVEKQHILPIEPVVRSIVRAASVTVTPPHAEPPAPAQAGVLSSVSIASDVAGADIDVDGAFSGNTPSILRLSPGRHVIKVSKGSMVWQREVDVLAGSSQNLNAVLSTTPQ